jgi:type I restriction enzyme S subunit
MMSRTKMSKVPLGELGKWIGGGTPSKSNPIFWQNGSIPWVSPKDMSGTLISDSEDYITEEAVVSSATNLVKKGSLLVVTRSGILRKTVPVAITGVDLAINQDMKALVPKDSISIAYVANVLWWQNDNLRNLCVKTGTTVESVDFELLKRFEILLPPKPEQDCIAAILGTWDEAIAKTQALIERKEEAYKSLSLKLLFGKKRLNGYPSVPERQKVHWFSVPRDWEIIPIHAIADEVSERNGHGPEVTVLSCTKHHGLVSSLEYFGKQIFSEDTSNYKLVSHGDFAYATNHIEEGSIGYQDLMDKGLVSPMYTVFRTDKSKICDGYLYKVLKTELFRHIFEANTSASVDRRGSLRWQQFSHLKIPYPSLEEQQDINRVLDVAKSEIKALQDYRTLLIDQKKGLMQKLLTGEWPVAAAQTPQLQEAAG